MNIQTRAVIIDCETEKDQLELIQQLDLIQTFGHLNLPYSKLNDDGEYLIVIYTDNKEVIRCLGIKI